jgi:DNA-binding NarL/FixJ family response regulator
MLELESAPTYGARIVLAFLKAQGHAPPLSPAERHVLTLLLDGHDSRAIARARSTSVRTIANQINSIFRKFRICSRTELAALASGPFHGEIHRDWLARQADPNPASLLQLTPRQQRILRLRASGHSIKFIGFELGITISTASTELTKAMRDLDIRSPLELCAVFSPTNTHVAA